MDWFTIIATHNRLWTTREITWFSCILFAVAIGMIFLLKKKKIYFSQAAAGMALVIYLAIVFASTVFTRIPQPDREYRLELFWSWKEVFFHHNMFLLEENLLNMLLLFPAGFLLPILFRKKLPWRYGLLLGAGISLGIELCQLIFCRGLFEWDDIIHNGIGCMMGSVIGGRFMLTCYKDIKRD